MNTTDHVGDVLARYPYRARWWTLLWTSAFFAVCGVVLTHRAASADDLFLWILAAASWGFVLVAVGLAAHRVARPSEVVVGSIGLVVPDRGRRTVVRFDELTAADIQEVSGQRFLRLHHDAGGVNLVSSMFPRDDDFTAVASYVLTGEWAPEAPHSPVAFEAPPTWMPLALKLAALLSFCGGPLWIADELAPLIGKDPGFVVAFAPLAVVILATLSALEDERTPWTALLARAGALCCGLIVLESVAALFSLWFEPGRPDAGVIAFGSAVSFIAAALYARIVRRFLAS